MPEQNKKLRILLMTPWLEYFCGGEVHFYTMAKELIRLGHEVSMYTYLKGPMWGVLKNSGITLLENDPRDEYDLAIMNGNPCLTKAPKSAYKIMVLNGIIPSQEYPFEGVDKYVAVSEEVAMLIFKKGFKNTIIRNGIDCERFKMIRPANKTIKDILILSNKQGPGSNVFKALYEICKECKINLTVLGLQFGTAQWNVEKFINMNDLVVSIGRGALEAMACERNVLICDYSGMDGMISEKNYNEIKKNNFSGRKFRMLPLKSAILIEIDKYDRLQGKKNRSLILDNHDIKKTVDNYLQLYYYRGINI